MNKDTYELFHLLSSCTAAMVDYEHLLFPQEIESVSDAPELLSEFPDLSEVEIEEKIAKGSIEAYLFDLDSREETIHCQTPFEKKPNGVFSGKNAHGEEIDILPLFPKA